MGMARHAPSTYQRHYYITPYAVIGLRESTADRYAHRDDEDLANLLDESIARAVHDGHSDNVIDDGQFRRVVDLSSTTIDVELYAVCRPDARERRDVVMTILTADEASSARSSGRWQQRNATGVMVPVDFGTVLREQPLVTPPTIVPDAAVETPPAPQPEQPIIDEEPLMAKKTDPDWISRPATAKLLKANPNYLSTIATAMKWPKRKEGVLVFYGRAAVEAYQSAGLETASTATKRKAAPTPRKALAPHKATAAARDVVTPVPVAAGDAPMYLLRVSNGDKAHHLECTESELDAAWRTLVDGGTPATAIIVYRMIATRLRLELV